MDAPVGVDSLVGSVGERMLQQAYGTRERAQRFYDTQVVDRLSDTMTRFIGRQEMMFVSTADADGRCDSTFRAGPPGFVSVLNERQVAWPEYRGNGVMASLGNIAVNGNAGLLFVDFFEDLIGLHVNGRAEIVEDLPEIATDRRCVRWVRVDVEEAYIHCRKHIPLLAKVPRDRSWGTDDARRKGGDYFEVRRRAAAEPVPERRRWWQRRPAGR
ncbi:pyridoxamine 5'-phosphate oxidase family protein [Asanoa sp. NPDC049573]|uniref:pyridoxamine 5'-phosphate oxidase family protein n=1 Tax=Asanoa sp. NPDC049573 TaxID=3155396 RepID=UPI003449B8F0